MAQCSGHVGGCMQQAPCVLRIGAAFRRQRLGVAAASHPSAASRQRSRISRGVTEQEEAQTDKAVAEHERGGVMEIPEELQSEADAKLKEAERLRAAEKFMTVGTGEAECIQCGYLYDPRKGDPEYPVSPNTQFQDLPEDWQCPTCGAEQKTFQSRSKTIAGFAENQKYGIGTNSMTEGQKSRLIFGSLFFFFCLFLLGYTIN